MDAEARVTLEAGKRIASILPPENWRWKGRGAYREIRRGGRSMPDGICAVNAGSGVTAAIKELLDAGDQSGIAGMTAAPTQQAAQALQKLLLKVECVACVVCDTASQPFLLPADACSARGADMECWIE